MSLPDSLLPYIGRHFKVEALLGSGGTSRVVSVIDQRSGQRLALKQALNAAPAQRSRTHALFRQEFHVLSRIAHPNVVVVYEYGFDAGRPFYTMELVRGRALSELVPLPWQQLCAIIIDLCSPLSMLHARRFVHCDVTARNVLVTESGQTKLIDFGALTALDRPATIIAGTPPHMAPELVRKQSIDGRADMFALGALAYSMLAGRHAYPARTIQELPQVWAEAPATLGELGVDVPGELDHLIMSLLSLDAGSRPAQLAELVQRLAAILGQAPETGTLQAQLATPKLVGRDAALEQFRHAQQAAVAGQGGVVCIGGKKGMGRSRMLEACALEVIHAGSLLVHVNTEHAASAPYALFAQIVLSACSQEAAALDHLPESLRDSMAGGQGDLLSLAHKLASCSAAELERCWRALCTNRSAVVLIDDLARADVPSIQACLSQSDAAKQWPLLVVGTISADAEGGSLERDVAALVSVSRKILLSPLSQAETAQVVSSLFGETAELGPLTDWIYRASLGVPAACVELARHALEHGYVRYAEGQFRISQDALAGRVALPRAWDRALTQAIDGLSAGAREALAVLSLLTPFGALTAIEQVELLCSGGAAPAEVLEALDELSDAQLVALIGDAYELRSSSSQQQASAQLSAASAQAWQIRLAKFYEQRGHDYILLSALHFEQAGESAIACQKAIAMEALMRGPDDPNIRLGGSPTGVAFHQRMLAYAISSGRPRVEQLHLRRVLMSIGATADPSLRSEGPALLEALRDDIGLLFLESAPATASDHEKLLFALSRAQERFTQTPAGERLSPLDAIRSFAAAVASLSSMHASASDAPACAELAAMFRPLRTLAPVLEFSYQLVETSARLLSRGGRETARWRSMHDAIRDSNLGLPDLIWKYMLNSMHFNLGRDLAPLGAAEALEHAQLLAGQRRTEMQACSVRLLHALAYGDHRTAAEQRRKRAIAALASRHEDQRLVASYVTELQLVEACGDLVELQQLAAWFDAKAVGAPRAMPIAGFARACCQLLCGQLTEAETVIQKQLEAAPPLQHFIWFPLRALRAELALLRGDVQLAKQMAEDVLRMRDQAGLDFRPDTRAERVLALAHAALGDTDTALALIEPLLEAVTTEPSSLTVCAGQLHETRARIALLMQDREAFRRHYARVQAVYARHAHPGLMAKLQRLASAATHSQTARGAALAPSQRLTTIQTDLHSLDPADQYDYLLGILVQDAHSRAGYLYDLTPALHCVAAYQSSASDAALERNVSAYLERLNAWSSDRTQSVMVDTDLAITRARPDALEQFHVVPLRGSAGQLQGLALLLASSAEAIHVRTEGLATIVADVLVQLRK